MTKKRQLKECINYSIQSKSARSFSLSSLKVNMCHAHTTHTPPPAESQPANRDKHISGRPSRSPSFSLRSSHLPSKALEKGSAKEKGVSLSPLPNPLKKPGQYEAPFILGTLSLSVSKTVVLCWHQETEGPGCGWLWGCWPSQMALGPQYYFGFDFAQQLHLWAGLLRSLCPPHSPGWELGLGYQCPSLALSNAHLSGQY